MEAATSLWTRIPKKEVGKALETILSEHVLMNAFPKPYKRKAYTTAGVTSLQFEDALPETIQEWEQRLVSLLLRA